MIKRNYHNKFMNYKIDEGNIRFPDMKRMNKNVVRIYFDQAEVEREGMDGETITIYTAKCIDVNGNPESALAGAIEVVTSEIINFDNSSAVNEFIVNGIPMWLDNATRDKLTKRLNVDKKSGLSETKLVYEGLVFELPIATAEVMLLQLEQYARDCFDQTNEHLGAVKALSTVKEVVEYDYTIDYPEKLEFNL